jgi:hypothetical protein
MSASNQSRISQDSYLGQILRARNNFAALAFKFSVPNRTSTSFPLSNCLIHVKLSHMQSWHEARYLGAGAALFGSLILRRKICPREISHAITLGGHKVIGWQKMQPPARPMVPSKSPGIRQGNPVSTPPTSWS